MSRIFSKKVYIHPDAPRKFYHKDDIAGWCEDNAADKSLIETFDSVSEYNRWLDLCEQERAGEISELRRQVRYLIIPGHEKEETVGFKVKRVYWVDGMVFGTKAEAKGYCRANGIKQKDITWYDECVPRMKKVKLSSPHYYTADFVYKRGGEEVVEDCKSKWTRKEKDYVLRRDLMLDRHGIVIFEFIT